MPLLSREVPTINTGLYLIKISIIDKCTNLPATLLFGPEFFNESLWHFGNGIIFISSCCQILLKLLYFTFNTLKVCSVFLFKICTFWDCILCGSCTHYNLTITALFIKLSSRWYHLFKITIAIDECMRVFILMKPSKKLVLNNTDSGWFGYPTDG